MKEAETKHEVIERYYMNLVEENKVSAGEQLPSENEIASIFNVSRHTVRLKKDGYIRREEREVFLLIEKIMSRKKM